MAKETKAKPVFTLPKEMVERMEKTGDDIDRAENGIAVMKRIGMDTRELEEKIEWVKNVRKTLLEEFK